MSRVADLLPSQCSRRSPACRRISKSSVSYVVRLRSLVRVMSLEDFQWRYGWLREAGKRVSTPNELSLERPGSKFPTLPRASAVRKDWRRSPAVVPQRRPIIRSACDALTFGAATPLVSIEQQQRGLLRCWGGRQYRKPLLLWPRLDGNPTVTLSRLWDPSVLRRPNLVSFQGIGGVPVNGWRVGIGTEFR